MLCSVVTPSGLPSSPPQEHEEGEAGFSLLFPAMDGVTIRLFHFCKKTLSETAMEEAGEVFRLLDKTVTFRQQ